jgi:NarL family two-component system sensor histidine kinase LiaS
VAVSLDRIGGDIVLEIADNGVGFELDERSEGGLGLRGMKERAASLGGSVEVTTRPGSGTRVRVTVPLSGGTSG